MINVFKDYKYSQEVDFLENILIFRSAKHQIVKSCINDIYNMNNNYSVWICVQQECAGLYRNQKNHLIIAPNGFFDYDSFSKNKKLVKQLKIYHFKKIYIPYSGTKPNCYEILKIVRNIIGKRHIFYYNQYGNINYKYINIWRSRLHKYVTSIIEYIQYKILILIYYICINTGR